MLLSQQPRIVLRLLLLSILLFTGCQRYGLGPGERWPDFGIVQTISGDELSYDDLSGRVVILHFFASWCEGCIEEIQALGKLRSLFDVDDLLVVGVAIDDKSEKVKTIPGINLFPVHVDVAGKLKKMYKVQGVPETLVIDQSGKIVLFLDPESSDQPRTRMLGPRRWDSFDMQDRLRAIVGASNTK